MTDLTISQPVYRNTAPLAALRGAASAYGVSLPSILTDALDRQAEVSTLVRNTPADDYDLIPSVIDADDINAALAEANAERNVRDAARALNKGNALVNAAKGRVNVALGESHGPLWQSIVKGIGKDTATLSKYAASLPENAVDPASILAHNGGAKAWAEIEPVLSRLSLAVDAMPYVRADVSRALPAEVARLLWLLDVAEAEPHTSTGPWENDLSSPRSQRLRAAFGEFRKAVSEDARRALIDVARGRFEGITLSPASDVEDVRARARRFAVSQVMVKHRDGDRDAPAGLILN